MPNTEELGMDNSYNSVSGFLEFWAGLPKYYKLLYSTRQLFYFGLGRGLSQIFADKIIMFFCLI